MSQASERVVRRFIVGGAVAVLAVGTTACGSSGVSSGDGPTVGVIAAVTGSQALDGKFTIDAVKLAVKKVNSQGGVLGKKLQYKVEDNATTNAGTVNAFNKLTSSAAPSMIIAPPISTTTLAIIPADQSAQIPLFTGGSLPELTSKGDKYLFRTRPSDVYTAKATAGYTINKLHQNNIALIHSSDAFGVSAAKLFGQWVKKLGGHLATNQSYDPGSSDYSSQILAVKNSGASALVTYFTEGEDNGTFAKQLRQLGVTNQKMPWIGAAAMPSAPSLKIGGKALWGTYMVSDAFAGANPQAKSFFAAYQKAYHNTADLNATYAYDAVMIFARAANQAKSLDPDKVAAEIHSMQNYKGVEGTYNFDSHGDGLHSDTVVQDVNGTMKFAGTD